MDAREVPRWQQRFDNFSRAFVLLREAIETLDERSPSQLEKEGIIQRFEYTWELAWKTLRDFLDYQGIVLSSVSPRTVIKAAHEAAIISHGDDWMAALDARNRMAHTYSFQAFDEVLIALRSKYFGLIDSLHEMLLYESLNTDGAE